jgi:DNA-binding response OmpR family regulator
MSEATLRPAGSLRILVAEDEPHIRRIIVTLLEAAGFQITVAGDGTEALEYLREEARLDLIVMDLMMPGHTGLEVLQETRRLPHRKATPVIILTAKGQDVDRNEAFALGADDFITKPFSPKKLLGRVDELLSRR